MLSSNIILPSWEEFENLFLDDDHKTLTYHQFYNAHRTDEHKHNDPTDYENDIIDSETYLDEYLEIFCFSSKAKYSLIGALTETFDYILGAQDFNCDIDWNSFKVGDRFQVTYKGKTIECIESYCDEDNFYTSMDAFSSLLYDAGLVLKTSVDAGIGSDFVYTLIPVEVWNQGVEKFGLARLEKHFDGYNIYPLDELPNLIKSENIQDNLMKTNEIPKIFGMKQGHFIMLKIAIFIVIVLCLTYFR